MNKDDFITVLEKEFLKYKFSLYEDIYQIDVIEPLLYTLRTKGNFLNQIPNDETEQNIRIIADWTYSYYFTNQIICKSQRYSIKKESNKEIKRIANVLINFQDIVEYYFGGFLDDISNFETTHYHDIEIETYKQISTALNVAKRLQEDIENKKFNLFPRNYFYKDKPTSKKDLESIIHGFNKKYNLKATHDDIKQLKDDLPKFTLYTEHSDH